MPLFTVPDYSIDESLLPEIAQRYSHIKSAKFYKVLLKENDLSELHEFDSLPSMVADERYGSLVYHYVDMIFENSLPLYLFIEIDKTRKHIVYYRDYIYLRYINGWLLYFNSKTQINFRNLNPNSGENLVYLRDNYPYKYVNFFVGISSLVEVMKHTTATSFQEVLPTLERKSRDLLEIRHFKH